MLEPITDPVVLEDISAHLMQRVFDAVREAELQRAGLLLPPPPQMHERVLMRRARLGVDPLVAARGVSSRAPG